MGVAASTSEFPNNSSNRTHAAEGFTFVELFIKFALEEVIIEFALSLWDLKEGHIRIGNHKMHKKRKAYSVGVPGADPPWR